MPEFTNPFIGNVPDRKLTPGELLRAIRLDYAAEYEATHIYMAQAEATDDPLAKKSADRYCRRGEGPCRRVPEAHKHTDRW